MIPDGTFLQQRYRIDKKIGQGGMGAVFVAMDERFGSRVAIKQTLCMDDNYRKAIEREARLLNSLKHAALPRVSDHFVEDDGQFLVMEFVPGDDLAFILERDKRPFPVDRVLVWAGQLLEALDYLHNQSDPVVHRDIKPQNLKINSRGQIILLDFGLAKGNVTDAGGITASKSIFGYSRNYASLEQIQGTGTDPRSDLYSLAATLYHLLTAVPPADALTRAMSVLSAQADPLVPANALNPEVPAGVSGILQKALDLNAASRPSTAREMREMLANHDEYGFLAEEVTILGTAPVDASSQPTRLFPGSTRPGGKLPTEMQTELLPEHNSGRSVAGASVITDPSPKVVAKKRYGARIAAAAALLIAGMTGASILIYETSSSGVAETPVEQPSADQLPFVISPNPVEAQTQTLDTQTPPDSANTNSAPLPPTLGAADPNKTGVTPARKNGQTRAASPSSGDVRSTDTDSQNPTIFVGNVKMKDGKIETPNAIIDDNGVHPKRPGVDLEKEFEGLRVLTPEQKKRLKLQMLRRNGVNVPIPPPNPPEN